MHGILTRRLICAKINYFSKETYDKNNLITRDNNIDAVKYIDMIQQNSVYVWDNIFDINCFISDGFLFFNINDKYKFYISNSWYMGEFIEILLGKNEIIAGYKDFVSTIFDKYDGLILFRIGFLIKLVEDNLLNRDTMHIILHKVFF